MKKCAICGQRTERGSFCGDCRAALKRARDETISQFQMRPAMALAGPVARPQRAAPRPVPKPHPRPRTLRAAEAVEERVPTADAAGTSLVWIIVALMVLVGGYVGYRMMQGTTEAGNRGAPVAATGTDALVAPAVRETQLGVGVQEESGGPAKRVGIYPPVRIEPPIAIEPGVAIPPIHPRPAQKPAAALSARELPAAIRSAANPASSAKPVSEPAVVTEPSPPEPVAAAKAASPPAAGAVVKPGKWERMNMALRACANGSLLGSLVCEQKVRWQYCEGQWGQVPQCPGSRVHEQNP